MQLRLGIQALEHAVGVEHAGAAQSFVGLIQRDLLTVGLQGLICSVSGRNDNVRSAWGAPIVPRRGSWRSPRTACQPPRCDDAGDAARQGRRRLAGPSVLRTGRLAYSAAMTAAAGVIDIRYTVRLLDANVSMTNWAVSTG
jgi:hypothetical protein